MIEQMMDVGLAAGDEVCAYCRTSLAQANLLLLVPGGR